MQYLGQHFLTNTHAVQAAIDGLAAQAGETVLEIGPGTGALTRSLIEYCAQHGCSYIGIERDRELAAALAAELAPQQHVRIVTGDVLHELPRLIPATGSFSVIGNIPYYITGAILRLIGELGMRPRVSVLMIQKEVAERLLAPAGSGNLLAAAVGVWATADVLMQLRQEDFDPPPKVRSTLIRLTTRQTIPDAATLARYYQTLHIAFKQPRKTLLNNITAGSAAPKEAVLSYLKQRGLPATARPQDLSVNECLRLSSWLKDFE